MKKIQFICLVILILCIQACSGSGNDSKSNEPTSETPSVGQSGVIDDASQKNVVQVAVESKDHTTLVTAVKAGELVDALSNAGPFTVFAPTNASFEAFLDGAALSDIPVDYLTQLLLNHTLTGVALSTDLTTGYTNTLATFNNEPDALLSLFVNTSAGVLLNAQSSVSSADNLAANGVVHIVDAVIALPSVVTFAVADPTFSTLVALGAVDFAAGVVAPGVIRILESSGSFAYSKGLEGTSSQSSAPVLRTSGLSNTCTRSVRPRYS